MSILRDDCVRCSARRAWRSSRWTEAGTRPIPPGQFARISTTAGRAKARNLAHDPRAALHVSGDNFWAYAVAERRTTQSAVATTPGDAAGRELLAVHTSSYGDQEPEAFYRDMIASRRLVIRVHLEHVYGIIATGGRRPQPKSRTVAGEEPG